MQMKTINNFLLLSSTALSSSSFFMIASATSRNSNSNTNLLRQAIKNSSRDQYSHRWLEEDDIDGMNCDSILESYDNGENKTCVDVNDSDGTASFFIGNTYANDDGNEVESFLGIQYATQERFSPSEMAIPTSGAVNATEFGDACPPASAVNYSVGEDCLNLNIWRPSGVNEDNPLPVIVWIHGGGFIGESAVLYDGSNIAGNEDIMFVSIDYRLGIFGYLPRDMNGTGGMNGILDQVEALKWVKQYISYFGGDPNQVTIFGQSAGAHSIGILNVLPQANGLFQRSIMDSTQAYPLRSPEMGMKTVESVLDDIDCPSNPCAISFLENLNTTQLVNFTSLFLPTLDTAVVSADIPTLYERGNINSKDMILGANTYDDPRLDYVLGEDYVELANKGLNSTYQWKEANLSTEEEIEAALDAYSIDKYNGSIVEAYAQSIGDSQFLCRSRYLAETAASNIDGSVYNYVFGYTNIYDLAFLGKTLAVANITDPNFSSHASELTYIFGYGHTNFFDGLPQFSDRDKSLSKEMMSRWSNFAKTGKPFASSGSSSEAEWIPVSTTWTDGEAVDPAYMYFTGDGGTMVESNINKTDQCAAIYHPGNLAIYYYNENDNSNGGDVTDENVTVSKNAGEKATPVPSNISSGDIVVDFKIINGLLIIVAFIGSVFI